MILGDGSGPAKASPYTSAPQITSPLSKLLSTTTTITPVGVNIPLLPPPGSLRRYSEADVQNVQNAHDVLSVYGTANPTMYPSLPESSGYSPESSSAQSFSSEFTDPTPGPAHGGDSFTLMNVEDPFLSTSPDSTDDSAGSTLSGPPPSSIFTPGSTPPSHIPNHHHHHVSLHYPPATSSSSSLDRQLERAQRRSGRRRSEPPRDQKATNRLSDQRRLDDENTEALYKLFVPQGAEVKWKKDRLGISALAPFFSLCV
jgi:hypothetical protein